jgi:C-terminal processing protease CtpA/Prc
VQDDPNETLATFCTRLFDYIDEAEADRLVIDLRRNTGGNNYLNQPLIHALLRCERVNRPGHLFVLASPTTFSAAVNAASDLERETQALFVGEPTGAGPNHFGDAELIELPRTKLRVFVSTVRWQKSDPRDARRWILPDLPAPATFADFRAGRDAALEAALSADPAGWEGAAAIEPIRRWRRPNQSGRWPPSR